MIKIPVVFAIDNNVVMPCGVTITSLLMNAKVGTFYDIYILCKQSQLTDENKGVLQQAFASEKKCKITFVDVGEAFKESEGLAEGHITTATYFRLAIPSLFPQFDKAIYADIDIDVLHDAVLRKDNHLVAVEEPLPDEVPEVLMFPGLSCQPVSGVEEERKDLRTELGDELHAR